MAKPRVTRVVDDVYCVMRRSYFTCCYLARVPSGLVAIDAGMKTAGGDILAALTELGVTARDVRAILLTHWHNDHAAGAAELAVESGAPVFYSADDAAHLTRERAARGLRGWLSSKVPESGPLVLLKGLLGNAPQEPVSATNYVRGGDVLLDDFEVMDTPGHTHGHVSYYQRSTGVLYSGDALAVVAGRLRFMARPTMEDRRAARESMRKCLSRELKAICPGHREPLSTRVESERRRLLELVSTGDRWPLFG